MSKKKTVGSKEPLKQKAVKKKAVKKKVTKKVKRKKSKPIPGQLTFPQKKYRAGTNRGAICSAVDDVSILEDVRGRLPAIVRSLEEYGQLVLQKSLRDNRIWQTNQVDSLDLSDVQDLAPLAAYADELSNLRKLHLDFQFGRLQDISPIASLHGLTVLSCMMARVSDLSPIASLTNLESLEIDGDKFSDLSALVKLPNLRELYLTGYGSEIDIRPLKKIATLKSLVLRQISVDDLTPICKLPVLEEIELIDTDIRDYSPLQRLKQLRKLVVTHREISSEEIAMVQKMLPNCKVSEDTE